MVPGSSETDRSQALIGGAIAHIRAIAGLQRANANVAQYQQTGRPGAVQLVKKRRVRHARPLVWPATIAGLQQSHLFMLWTT